MIYVAPARFHGVQIVPRQSPGGCRIAVHEHRRPAALLFFGNDYLDLVFGKDVKQVEAGFGIEVVEGTAREKGHPHPGMLRG